MFVLRVGRALGLTVALASCGLAPSPVPSPATPVPTKPEATASIPVIALPTVPATTFTDPCADGLTPEATLAGDPSDPRVVWMEGGGPTRIELVWPPGFVARLSSPIEVLADDGSVFARVGDPIPVICALGEDLVYFASLNH